MVTGVPGVGKTTVLDHVQGMTDRPVVNFGSAMLKHARQAGFKGGRDELPTHPAVARWRADVAAALPEHVIIDGHLVVADQQGLRDAMPPELKEPGFLQAIAILHADPAAILERRRGDRPGGDVPTEFIARHQAAIVDHAEALEGVEVRVLEVTGRESHDVAADLVRLLGVDGAS
jgi:adenylate kinase